MIESKGLDMDGISIVDEHERRRRKGKANWSASKRWMGRAFDPLAMKYRCHCFEEKAEAIAWAEKTRASFVLGQDSACKADLESVTARYLDDLKGRSNAQHYKEVSEILKEVIAAGITDLRDDLFMARIRRWIENRGVLEQNRQGQQGIRRRKCLTLSERTKNLYVGHVRKAVNYAVNNRIINLDPMRGWKPYRENKPMKPVFTVQECRALLDATKAKEPFAIPVWLMLLGGLRLQEACFLSWEDVLWEEGQINIRIKDAYRLKFNKERSIDLQSDLRKLLAEHRKPTGWVVDLKDEEGVAYRDRQASYRHWFKKYLSACGVGLNRRSPHSCRHTYLSLLLASGADVYSVMQTAGHQNIQTTMGYCKSAPVYKRCNAWTGAGELKIA